MGLPIDIAPFKEADIFVGPDDPSQILQHKIWLTGLKAEKTLQEAKIQYLSNNMFKIDLPSIICTGSDVTTIFNIPFMHELQKLELKHTDSSNADSIDSFNYLLSKRTLDNLLLKIHNMINIIHSDIYDEFINFFHGSCQYQLITNTTNTDLIYTSVYIKITGG